MTLPQWFFLIKGRRLSHYTWHRKTCVFIFSSKIPVYRRWHTDLLPRAALVLNHKITWTGKCWQRERFLRKEFPEGWTPRESVVTSCFVKYLRWSQSMKHHKRPLAPSFSSALEKDTRKAEKQLQHAFQPEDPKPRCHRRSCLHRDYSSKCVRLFWYFNCTSLFKNWIWITIYCIIVVSMVNNMLYGFIYWIISQMFQAYVEITNLFFPPQLRKSLCAAGRLPPKKSPCPSQDSEFSVHNLHVSKQSCKQS